MISLRHPIKQIHTSIQHELVVYENGELYGRGDNYHNQAHSGDFTDHKHLIKIADDVKSVSGGQIHSIFVKYDGTAWGMGSNNQGQISPTLRKGEIIVTPLCIMDDVEAVACGFFHTIFLLKNNSATVCGKNTSGELGFIEGSSETDRMRVAQQNVRQVAAGAYSTFILRQNGALYATGENYKNMHGDDSGCHKTVWKKVRRNVRSIKTGWSYLIVTGDDGRKKHFGASPVRQMFQTRRK